MRPLLWVAGGRDFTNEEVIRSELFSYHKAGMTLITGAARGVDLTAERVWRGFHLPYIGVPARWQEHGRAAGPIRNEIIAKGWHPTAAVFFPGGRGTAHAIEMARKYGIPSREVTL